MILGVGIDICPVDRIKDVISRQGDSFTKKLFTENERRWAGEGPVKMVRLAARFAAKEAAIKALEETRKLSWLEIEVTNKESGAPQLNLKGAAALRANSMGVKRYHLTISHDGGIAVAVVILEG